MKWCARGSTVQLQQADRRMLTENAGYFLRRWVAIAIFAGIAALAGPVVPANAAPAMTFRLVETGNLSRCGNRCQKVIVAEGEIVRDTPKKFVRFIRRHMRIRGVRAVIFVHSPGGLVVASMQLGKLFRKLGAAAVVARIQSPRGRRGKTIFTSAKCFSACVYALMGAKKRVVPPQSQLVVHRMFMYEMLGDVDTGGFRNQKTYRNSKLYTDLTRYARMMGVSSNVVHAAENTPAGKIRIISQREMRKWRLGVPRF